MEKRLSCTPHIFLCSMNACFSCKCLCCSHFLFFFLQNPICMQLSNLNGSQINCLKFITSMKWEKQREPSKWMVNVSHDWATYILILYFICSKYCVVVVLFSSSSFFFSSQKKRHPIIGLTTLFLLCFCAFVRLLFFFSFSRTGFSVSVELISHARVHTHNVIYIDIERFCYMFVVLKIAYEKKWYVPCLNAVCFLATWIWFGSNSNVLNNIGISWLQIQSCIPNKFDYLFAHFRIEMVNFSNSVCYFY